MKSNKQRRAEIKAARKKRIEKQALIKLAPAIFATDNALAVDRLMFAPNNSCGWPTFANRGYYLPYAFICKSCGKAEAWTAAQQKWWYETARGDLFSTAVRCRPCRAQERVRKAEARVTSLAGFLKKQQQKIEQHETQN
jgi:hypothetical protein